MFVERSLIIIIFRNTFLRIYSFRDEANFNIGIFGTNDLKFIGNYAVKRLANFVYHIHFYGIYNINILSIEIDEYFKKATAR